MIAPDSLVTYPHPDFGPVTGRVILLGADKGEPAALCQDLSPNGAREWWPLAECRLLLNGGRPLQALTIMQPFPSAILAGVKAGENRGKPPDRRLQPGDWLVVHSGAKAHPNHDNALALWPSRPPNAWFPYSAILGAARYTGCVPGWVAREAGDEWAIPGFAYWTFDRRVTLPEPIPCGGKQGLWAVPAEHLSVLEAACAVGA